MAGGEDGDSTIKSETDETTEHDSNHEEEIKEKEEQETNDQLISLEDIEDVKHPLVEKGIISSDEISLPQKIAIYCINNSNGSCDKHKLLSFFEKHHEYIKDKNTITLRYITSILASRFGRHKLFKINIHDKNCWCLTDSNRKEPSSASTTQHSESDGMHSSEKEEMVRSESEDRLGQNEHSFQNAVIDLIKSSEYGLSIQEITEEAKKFSELPGTWHNLPIDRRVKACLRHKNKEVSYDSKSMVWISNENKKKVHQMRRDNVERDYPEIFKEVDIPKLSVTELYNFLKSEGVYK